MDAYKFVRNLRSDLNKRSVVRIVRLFKSQRNSAQNSTQTFSVRGGARRDRAGHLCRMLAWTPYSCLRPRQLQSSRPAWSRL